MNTTETLSALCARNATVAIHKRKLVVIPASALDETLTQAVRANRLELTEWARRHPYTKSGGVCSVLEEFGGSVIGYEGHAGDTLVDHLPGTIRRPCEAHRGQCNDFNRERLLAHTVSGLAAKAVGCGSCDIARQFHQLQKWREDREKVEEREKRKAIANRQAMRFTSDGD